MNRPPHGFGHPETRRQVHPTAWAAAAVIVLAVLAVAVLVA